MSTVQSVPPPVVKQKTLTEQKTDFTSEGSPPPGVVGGIRVATPAVHETGKPGAPPVEPDQSTPPSPVPGNPTTPKV